MWRAALLNYRQESAVSRKKNALEMGSGNARSIARHMCAAARASVRYIGEMTSRWLRVGPLYVFVFFILSLTANVRFRTQPVRGRVASEIICEVVCVLGLRAYGSRIRHIVPELGYPAPVEAGLLERLDHSYTSAHCLTFSE